MNFLFPILFVPLFLPALAMAQSLLPAETRNAQNIPDERLLSTISDTTGILIYEPLNYALGGDSIRNDRRGYAARGWIEDFYPSGKLLHRGYYFEGQLKAYKNFYEPGQVERDFKTIDNFRSVLITYYSNGNVKSNIQYREGYPVMWEDFYADGKLEYMEEFHKSLEYYLVKKSFYPGGQQEMIFELLDPKKRIFSSKEFYASGVVKEEGKLVFNKELSDYQRIEKWRFFNENGKLIKEEYYEEGRVVKENEY
ncbi:MAG: hypothetical protein HYY40_02810 [Bacteroidetes bacterium]|nr:hypothetical protein [Bacteroidota bacterium]